MSHSPLTGYCRDNFTMLRYRLPDRSHTCRQPDAFGSRIGPQQTAQKGTESISRYRGMGPGELVGKMNEPLFHHRVVLGQLQDAQLPATRPHIRVWVVRYAVTSTDFLSLAEGRASCEPPGSGLFYHTMNRFFCFCAVYWFCRTAADPQTTFITPHMSNSTTFPSLENGFQ